jgi:predicted MPP superfamily phosphohydrolase
LILLGGDLVDCRRGLPLLSRTTAELSRIAPVWAVPGNHDVRAGLSEIQSTVEQAGGAWLVNRSASVETKADPTQRLVVDGTPRNIPAIQPAILCAHNPEIFPQAARRGYSLVLAGHLHGCQFIAGERDGKLLPGGWFYQWNGLRFAEGSCTMLVSRGVSDTLPLRWNCPREILLCEIY